MNPLLVAGATAALVSKRGRTVVRKGLVYGLAGAMTVGEEIAAAARSVSHTAEHAASTTGGTIASAARAVKEGAGGAASGIASEVRELRGHGEEGEAERPAQKPRAAKSPGPRSHPPKPPAA